MVTKFKKWLFAAIVAFGLIAGSAVVAAPAQANHSSGGPVVYYTYHYDWRCQWNVKYAGEPFYKGYMYKVWHRTTHTDYSYVDEYYHGFRDKATTAFSHREYSTSFPRCAGGSW